MNKRAKNFDPPADRSLPLHQRHGRISASSTTIARAGQETTVWRLHPQADCCRHFRDPRRDVDRSIAIRLSGDPAIMLEGAAAASPSRTWQNIRRRSASSRPFLRSVSRLPAADSGRRFRQEFMGGTPVSRLIAEALPATLLLAFRSAHHVASSCRCRSASMPPCNRGRWPDQLIRILSLVGLSFPISGSPS